MRLSIINITIIGLLLITGCSTKDKNSSKEVKVLSVKETKLNAGIYNVLEGSSQVSVSYTHLTLPTNREV